MCFERWCHNDETIMSLCNKDILLWSFNECLCNKGHCILNRPDVLGSAPGPGCQSPRLSPNMHDKLISRFS